MDVSGPSIDAATRCVAVNLVIRYHLDEDEPVHPQET